MEILPSRISHLVMEASGACLPYYRQLGPRLQCFCAGNSWLICRWNAVTNRKSTLAQGAFCAFVGEPRGTRTLNRLIKSQLLCQLS